MIITKQKRAAKKAARAVCEHVDRTFAELPILTIHVGTRRREDLGSLVSLMASMERLGQLEMIVVRPARDGFEIVAGLRRLRAAQALGWKQIQASIGRFTDEQLREIELDENIFRVDLTELEAAELKAAKGGAK